MRLPVVNVSKKTPPRFNLELFHAGLQFTDLQHLAGRRRSKSVSVKTTSNAIFERPYPTNDWKWPKKAKDQSQLVQLQRCVYVRVILLLKIMNSPATLTEQLQGPSHKIFGLLFLQGLLY
jgi:hypothetical protein